MSKVAFWFGWMLVVGGLGSIHCGLVVIVLGVILMILNSDSVKTKP